MKFDGRTTDEIRRTTKPDYTTRISSLRPSVVVVVVVDLRPRETSKVMSGRSVNLTTLFRGSLRPPKLLTVLHAHTVASN